MRHIRGIINLRAWGHWHWRYNFFYDRWDLGIWASSILQLKHSIVGMLQADYSMFRYILTYLIALKPTNKLYTFVKKKCCSALTNQNCTSVRFYLCTFSSPGEQFACSPRSSMTGKVAIFNLWVMKDLSTVWPVTNQLFQLFKKSLRQHHIIHRCTRIFPSDRAWNSVCCLSELQRRLNGQPPNTNFVERSITLAFLSVWPSSGDPIKAKNK